MLLRPPLPRKKLTPPLKKTTLPSPLRKMSNAEEAWPQSIVSEEMRVRLCKEGVIPSSICYILAEGVGNPTVPEEHTVILLDQFKCGLSFPPSDFLADVLNMYVIQLMHLTPDDVLILASFAHLFESYLGILPSAGLFQFFFFIGEIHIQSFSYPWYLLFSSSRQHDRGIP